MPIRGSGAPRAETHATRPASDRIGPWRIRTHLLVVAGVFFGLRSLLWATGLRFQDHLVGQLQLLDEHLLQADPFRAFTVLNTQPPLWNFFVGAVRAWSPLPDAFSFQVLFIAADLATVAMLWWILVFLGARNWQATVAAVVVASSPLVILNESYLRYETLVTLLVTASIYAYCRYVRSPTLPRFVAFCIVLALGVQTRTLLQPIWMLGGFVLALFVAYRKSVFDTKKVLVVVAIIMLMAGQLVYLNQNYGNIGYSSFVGENLKRIAVTTLSQSELEELEASGKVSELASVKPFSPYSAYAESLPACEIQGRDPALTEPRKSTGEVNLNYLCFRAVHRIAFEDAIAAIRSYPGNYATSALQSALLFSSWPVPFDEPDSHTYRWLVSAYKPLLLPVHVHYDIGGDDPQGLAAVFLTGLDGLPVLLTMLVGIGMLLYRGIASTWLLVRGRATPGRLVECWVGFTVASVCFVGVFFDFYENARFREALDPIILGTVVVAVTNVSRSLVGRIQKSADG